MLVDLAPEIIGLILTPAAIAGCILLLQSQRPYLNAIAFGAAFIVLYAAISIIVLAIGSSVDASDDSSISKGIVGITVGALFILLGIVIALHHQQTREGHPSGPRCSRPRTRRGPSSPAASSPSPTPTSSCCCPAWASS
jgi:hypothetical protein